MTSFVPVLYNKEIIAELKKLFAISSDAALGRHLDVSKQSLNSFVTRTNIDINNKIISHLLAALERIDDPTHSS